MDTRTLCGFLLATFLPAVAWSQPAGARLAESEAPPTELGVRLTPEMARGLGTVVANELFRKRYELEEAQVAAASEAFARRLMAMAHAHEERGQEISEYLFAKGLEVSSRMRAGTGDAPNTIFGQGMAEQLLPVMPAIKEMANGVMQDVRPMLSFKQQLKMTADIALMNVALASFESTLKRWSKGEIEPFEDPFRSRERPIKKDADGESDAVKSARRAAERAAKREPWTEWAKYVEDAKQFYGFDASQAAAADSLLREYTERCQRAQQGADDGSRLYRNRVWWAMAGHLPGGWNGPFRALMEADYEAIREPVEALGFELKEKIDRLPTQAQRSAAEAKILEALAEKGYRTPEAVAAASTEEGP
ncbi:MAG: hypothetical protein AMXMBFR13_18450 [Phycisphaerae bacterium]